MKTSKLKSNQKLIPFLILLLILTVIFATAIGTVYIPPLEIIEILSPTNIREVLFFGKDISTSETIILQLRLPRICLGLLVGAALSVSGATMQGLFKNPMADPYIIGISSGALFGVASCMAFGIAFGYITPLIASFGAFGAVFLVYNIARVRGKVPVDTLLLSGIAVSYFFSACTYFLMYMNQKDMHLMFSWMMGKLYGSGWDDVMVVSLPIILGTIIIFFFARDMNVLLLGEEPAQNLGIEVENFKRIMMILASLITAAAVSVSGLIGFVGLMIPHIVRILFGPDHRVLIPSSAFVGGIFLVWTDTIARTIISPTELPVGIITAFFGAPFFIYLLRTRKRSIFG